MNNYIVYEKTPCSSCEEKGYINVGLSQMEITCPTCKGTAIALKEVPLEKAIIELLKDRGTLDSPLTLAIRTYR